MCKADGDNPLHQLVRALIRLCGDENKPVTVQSVFANIGTAYKDWEEPFGCRFKTFDDVYRLATTFEYDSPEEPFEKWWFIVDRSGPFAEVERGNVLLSFSPRTAEWPRIATIGFDRIPGDGSHMSRCSMASEAQQIGDDCGSMWVKTQASRVRIPRPWEATLEADFNENGNEPWLARSPDVGLLQFIRLETYRCLEVGGLTERGTSRGWDQRLSEYVDHLQFWSAKANGALRGEYGWLRVDDLLDRENAPIIWKMLTQFWGVERAANFEADQDYKSEQHAEKRRSGPYHRSSNPYTTDGGPPYDRDGNDLRNYSLREISKTIHAWVLAEAGKENPRLVTKRWMKVMWFRAAYLPGVTDLDSEPEIRRYIDHPDPWLPTLGRGEIPAEYDDMDKCSLYLEQNALSRRVTLIDQVLRSRNSEQNPVLTQVDPSGMLIPDVGELLGHGVGLDGMLNFAKMEMCLRPERSKELADARARDRTNPDYPLSDHIYLLDHSYCGLPNERIMFPRWFHEFEWWFDNWCYNSDPDFVTRPYHEVTDQELSSSEFDVATRVANGFWSPDILTKWRREGRRVQVRPENTPDYTRQPLVGQLTEAEVSQEQPAAKKKKDDSPEVQYGAPADVAEPEDEPDEEFRSYATIGDGNGHEIRGFDSVELKWDNAEDTKRAGLTETAVHPQLVRDRSEQVRRAALPLFAEAYDIRPFPEEYILAYMERGMSNARYFAWQVSLQSDWERMSNKPRSRLHAPLEKYLEMEHSAEYRWLTDHRGLPQFNQFVLDPRTSQPLPIPEYNREMPGVPRVVASAALAYVQNVAHGQVVQRSVPTSARPLPTSARPSEMCVPPSVAASGVAPAAKSLPRDVAGKASTSEATTATPINAGANDPAPAGSDGVSLTAGPAPTAPPQGFADGGTLSTENMDDLALPDDANVEPLYEVLPDTVSIIFDLANHKLITATGVPYAVGSRLMDRSRYMQVIRRLRQLDELNEYGRDLSWSKFRTIADYVLVSPHFTLETLMEVLVHCASMDAVANGSGLSVDVLSEFFVAFVARIASDALEEAATGNRETIARHAMLAKARILHESAVDSMLDIGAGPGFRLQPVKLVVPGGTDNPGHPADRRGVFWFNGPDYTQYRQEAVEMILHYFRITPPDQRALARETINSVFREVCEAKNETDMSCFGGSIERFMSGANADEDMSQEEADEARRNRGTTPQMVRGLLERTIVEANVLREGMAKKGLPRRALIDLPRDAQIDVFRSDTGVPPGYERLRPVAGIFSQSPARRIPSERPPAPAPSAPPPVPTASRPSSAATAPTGGTGADGAPKRSLAPLSFPEPPAADRPREPARAPDPPRRAGNADIDYGLLMQRVNAKLNEWQVRGQAGPSGRVFSIAPDRIAKEKEAIERAERVIMINELQAVWDRQGGPPPDPGSAPPRREPDLEDDADDAYTGPPKGGPATRRDDEDDGWGPVAGGKKGGKPHDRSEERTSLRESGQGKGWGPGDNGWKCACGNHNDAGGLFCGWCGKRRPSAADDAWNENRSGHGGSQQGSGRWGNSYRGDDDRWGSGRGSDRWNTWQGENYDRGWGSHRRDDRGWGESPSYGSWSYAQGQSGGSSWERRPNPERPTPLVMDLEQPSVGFLRYLGALVDRDDEGNTFASGNPPDGHDRHRDHIGVPDNVEMARACSLALASICRAVANDREADHDDVMYPVYQDIRFFRGIFNRLYEEVEKAYDEDRAYQAQHAASGSDDGSDDGEDHDENPPQPRPASAEAEQARTELRKAAERSQKSAQRSQPRPRVNRVAPSAEPSIHEDDASDLGWGRRSVSQIDPVLTRHVRNPRGARGTGKNVSSDALREEDRSAGRVEDDQASAAGSEASSVATEAAVGKLHDMFESTGPALVVSRGTDVTVHEFHYPHAVPTIAVYAEFSLDTARIARWMRAQDGCTPILKVGEGMLIMLADPIVCPALVRHYEGSHIGKWNVTVVVQEGLEKVWPCIYAEAVEYATKIEPNLIEMCGNSPDAYPAAEMHTFTVSCPEGTQTALALSRQYAGTPGPRWHPPETQVRGVLASYAGFNKPPSHA